MALYKRIALIRNQYDVDDIADELLDRFGDMPDAVDNLLRIALIRARAIELGIKQITETAGEIRMYQDTLNMPMWTEMSFAIGGRLRVIKGTVGDSFISVKLKNGENSLIIVNKMFENYLYSAGVPDPELIIRPSGEMRTSNFLLWQSAYSEFVFMDVLWPDFGPRELDAAILEYHRRDRRFGGV